MTIDNSAEVCREPDCEYVARCKFATNKQTELDSPNLLQLKIQKNGIALFPLTGSVDSTLEMEAQALLDRLGEYRGVLVYVSSQGGYGGSAKRVMRTLQEIGNNNIPVIAYIVYAVSAALEIALACPEVYASKDGVFGGLGTHSFNCFQGKKPVSVISTLTTKKIIDLADGPDVYDPKPYSSKIENEIQALCDSALLGIFRTISATRRANLDRLYPLLNGSKLNGTALVKIGLADGVKEPMEVLEILGNKIRRKSNEEK